MSPPTSSREKKSQLTRRERGIIAQREYRKRHSSTFNALKDENQRLKNAIRKIHQVASRRGDHGEEFYEALSEAAELADLGESDQASERVVIQHDIALPSNKWPSSEALLETGLSPNHTEMNDSPNAREGDQLYSSIRSPLWLNADRLVRIYDAPADVVPFLGEGLFTLAGCLYWACVNNAVSLWKKTKNMKEPSFSHQSRLDRIFNHSKHLNDYEFLLSTAQARLEFRKRGFVDRIHVQELTDENKNLSRLNEQVKQEYEARNEALHWWRDPHEVASYIKQHLTADESTQLQQVVEGRGSIPTFELFAPLFEPLAQSFVCFGDGPRWNLVHVSMTVGAWLEGRGR